MHNKLKTLKFYVIIFNVRTPYHEKILVRELIKLAHAGAKPVTFGLLARRSNQLN